MPNPTHQIRIIGPHDWAENVLSRITEHAIQLLGPNIRTTRQIRAARRVGHVRAYLTITPDVDAENQPDSANQEGRVP